MKTQFTRERVEPVAGFIRVVERDIYGRHWVSWKPRPLDEVAAERRSAIAKATQP